MNLPDIQIDIPFDGIMTLLVFIIGIPALVFQSMTPEVRRIIFKHPRQYSVYMILLIPILGAIIVSGVGIFTEFRFGSSPSFEHNLRWVEVFTALIILTITVGVYIPFRYGRKETIIRSLKFDALAGLRRSGRLSEQATDDLIDIGKNAESHQEKGLVLKTLHEIVGKVIANPSYRGDSLETPILKMIELVSIDSEPTSLENYRMTDGILQEVASTGKAILYTADLQKAVKAASGLGVGALIEFDFGLEIDNIVMNYVQTLGLIARQHKSLVTNVSESLFEIGSVAVEQQRNLIAVAALDKMVNMLYWSTPPKAELVADMLGLMAHFWVMDKGRRSLIRKRLVEVKNCIKQPLQKALRSAIHYHVDNIQFSTADKLVLMTKDLKPRKKK